MTRYARITQSVCKALNIPEEKVFVNVHKYGNTSAASVPIALCEAAEEGRVKDGDNLVLVSFGGGLTWAAAVVRWGVPSTLPELVAWRLMPLLRAKPLADLKPPLKNVAGTLMAIAGAISLSLFSASKKRD